MKRTIQGRFMAIALIASTGIARDMPFRLPVLNPF
jgi:hypothetical protein